MELHNGYKFKLDAGDKAMYTGMNDTHMQIVCPARSSAIVEIGGINLAPLLKRITINGAEVDHDAMVALLHRHGPCRIEFVLDGELVEVKQVKP